MRFLPKTLWGQLVSLLFIAMFLSQAVTLFLFADTRRLYQSSISEEELINRIVTTVNLVENTQRKFAKNIARDASTKDVKLKFEPRPILMRDHLPQYSQKLKRKINKRFGKVEREVIVRSGGIQNAPFFKSRIPDMIKVSVKIAPRTWLVANYSRPKLPLSWIAPLSFTLVLMMVSILLIVSLVVKRLTKPLGALGKAANDLGRGVHVEMLKETGTQDVRDVTRSFNQMNEKTKRFIDDRTKMLAAISHDLRTPITSLRLRAEFIEDKDMQAKILETLEEMQAMTEATLKFAKDANSKEKTKPTDLASLLNGLGDDYKDMGKNVTIKEPENSVQIILPLRVQAIKRALRNLIDNGLKYGEQVGIDFVLNIVNNQAEIRIADKGNGIDETEFEQVFEPFYRLEKSRNKNTGGVGLGLSIARNIIHAHGGDVGLKNLWDNGKIIGLEVKVTLPL